MKKVMISQPRYLPSEGYLDRIKMADVFIVLDSVQRVERGFENRNKIKNMAGVEKWLTIPIKSSSRALIKDTIIDGLNWKIDHINKVHEYYKSEVIDLYYGAYLANMTTTNYTGCLVKGLMYLSKLFNIKTEFVLASTISEVTNGGIDELIRLTKAVNGDVYLSGPTCLSYGLTHEYAQSNSILLEIDMGTKHHPWIESSWL